MNILLADDHSMILEGYISILKKMNNHYFKASNCQEVYEIVLRNTLLDIAILDYRMPAYEEKGMLSGIDCTILIQKHFPNCKIILITATEKAMTLYDIFNKAPHIALIVKSDYTSETFTDLENDYALGIPHYSSKVLDAINKVATRTTLIDPINREILMYIFLGYPPNNIHQFFSLSTSAIQERINEMSQDFNASDYQELLQFAIKENFV